MGNPVQKYDDVRWLYLNRAASNRRGEEEGKEKNLVAALCSLDIRSIHDPISCW